MMNFAFKTSNSFIALHPNERWPSEHNYLLCSTLKKKNKDFVFKKLTKLKNMVHSWEFLKCTIWNKEYMCKMLSLLTSEKCFHWCMMWLFFFSPNGLNKADSEGSYRWTVCWYGTGKLWKLTLYSISTQMILKSYLYSKFSLEIRWHNSQRAYILN